MVGSTIYGLPELALPGRHTKNDILWAKQGSSLCSLHQVGHAIGRHSLEKTTMVYGGMFAIDILMGLAQRLLTVSERCSGDGGT